MEKILDQEMLTIFNSFIGWSKDEKNYSDNTIKSYIYDLTTFFKILFQNKKRILCVKDTSEMTVALLRKYLSTLTCSNKSKKRSLSSIRAFYKFLEKKENIKTESVFQIHNIKTTRKLPKPILESDIKKILDHYRCSNNWQDYRNKAIFILLYTTGLRISELVSLNMIDIINCDFLNIFGKGDKNRLVPIMTSTISTINEYLRKFSEQNPLRKDILNVLDKNIISDETKNMPLFLSVKLNRISVRTIQDIIIKTRRKLNLSETYSLHSFRHSFASHMISNGADIRKVQEILGHSSPATTEIYTKIDSKKLIETYNNYMPKHDS